MKKLMVVAMAAMLALSVAACKPAGPNNCKSGDVSCDHTKGT